MKCSTLLLSGGLLLSAVVLARAELANGIDAVVDDSVITYHEVSALNDQTYESLLRQYRNDPALLEKKMNETRNYNLQVLVDRQLILHDFKSAGYSLPESVLDDLVQERIRQDFGDRATLTKTLEARGMTYDKFRQQVRERFIVEALRSKNISSEIIISPHKVETYYQAHREDYKVEDQVKLRVIVLKAADSTNAPSPDRLAEEIYAKIKEGASFADMAKIYSQGSERAQGGEWPWYDKSVLSRGLADIAKVTLVGNVSQVFSRTVGDDYWVYLYDNGRPALARHYGADPDTKKQKLLEERKIADASAFVLLPSPQEFYVMKVEEVRPEHYKTLSEVREEIEGNLLADERSRLEKQWLDKLKKKTFVRRF